MLLLAIAFAAGIAAGDAELARVAVWQALCVKAAALGALARGPRARTACAVAVAFAAGALLLAERRAAAWWPSAEARVEAVVEARVAASAERGDQAVVDLARRAARGRRGRGAAASACASTSRSPERSPLARAVAGRRGARAGAPPPARLARFDPGSRGSGGATAPGGDRRDGKPRASRARLARGARRAAPLRRGVPLAPRGGDARARSAGRGPRGARSRSARARGCPSPTPRRCAPPGSVISSPSRG